jgi:hypothetical protein
MRSERRNMELIKRFFPAVFLAGLALAAPSAYGQYHGTLAPYLRVA